MIQFPRDRASSLRYTAAPERGQHISKGNALLYFAYTARIEPFKMAEVAPGATFEFIAHLQEWALEFPISGNGWTGGLPTVNPNQADTVWGAVFTVPDDEIGAIDAVEAEEQRQRAVVEAIDRTGAAIRWQHTVQTTSEPNHCTRHRTMWL